MVYESSGQIENAVQQYDKLLSCAFECEAPTTCSDSVDERVEPYCRVESSQFIYFVENSSIFCKSSLAMKMRPTVFFCNSHVIHHSCRHQRAKFFRLLLGDLHLRLSNAADAIDCYSAALRLNPDELHDPGEIERCYLILFRQYSKHYSLRTVHMQMSNFLLLASLLLYHIIVLCQIMRKFMWILFHNIVSPLHYIE